MYLSIDYRTRFAYPEPVRQSHNELRAAPTSNATQRLLSYRFQSVPASRPLTYVDYWGTLVDAFGVRRPHSRLDIVVEAVVETQARTTVADAPRPALDDPSYLDRYWEYLQPSPHVELTDEVRELARDASAPARTAIELLQALSEITGARLDYVPGSTHIGESVHAILTKGSGVCQDYAHVLVALCRASGLAARYVSGYLYAADHHAGPSEEDQPITVQTHAWVEARIPGSGWLAVDPTNQQIVGERHVSIGAGRDYDDVAPLRGIYTGGTVPDHEADVEMRRLVDPAPSIIDQRSQQQ